jgi:AcrR family transcriptional regulator
MGRNRSFDEAEVVASCAAAFRTNGYEGTSIDDLVQATGLHRGSLYKAFGSKRGVFVLCLQQARATDATADETTDLLLVALLEVAPRDAEIRSLALELIEASTPPRTALTLGQRLLDRALEPTLIAAPKESA